MERLKLAMGRLAESDGGSHEVEMGTFVLGRILAKWTEYHYNNHNWLTTRGIEENE